MNLCVLILAKDERLGIGKTVQSVLDAGASARDIYVIDDGSSDGTGELAKSFGVSVLRNEKNISKAMSIRRITTHFNLTNHPSPPRSYLMFSVYPSDLNTDFVYHTDVLLGRSRKN
jgi:glycosyltransferase involved in cell wall biosynthesis